MLLGLPKGQLLDTLSKHGIWGNGPPILSYAIANDLSILICRSFPPYISTLPRQKTHMPRSKNLHIVLFHLLSPCKLILMKEHTQELVQYKARKRFFLEFLKWQMLWKYLLCSPPDSVHSTLGLVPNAVERLTALPWMATLGEASQDV